MSLSENVTDRINQFRESIKDRISAIERNYLALGRDLFLVHDQSLYTEWGYPTFASYLEQEVGIQRRKGERLRQIWKTFVKAFGIDKERFLKIRYSNLLQILSIVNRENVEEWIDLAEVLHYKQLQDRVDAYKAALKISESTGATPTPATPVVPAAKTKRRTFHLFPEQEEVVDEALSSMERRTGSSKPGYLLTSICTEYLATTTKIGTEEAVCEWMLKQMEARFGGKFVRFASEDDMKTALGL